MKRDRELPKRKEPGLLGKGIGSIIAFIGWMFMALLISILIEWAGIAWVWPEQGAQHSRDMVISEYRYLNHQVKPGMTAYRYQTMIIDTFNMLTEKIADSKTMADIQQMAARPIDPDSGRVKAWISSIILEFSDYIQAAFYITQLFFIRTAIVLLSITVFILFGIVGIADGLTERELRRWGAGRESSTVFNLARRMVYPVFIIACVLYISFPTTVHPALIMVPFGALFGYSLKVAFEKLKKYF
jgi:integrating conjugative element membrane protein (TIGR03747 family)